MLARHSAALRAVRCIPNALPDSEYLAIYTVATALYAFPQDLDLNLDDSTMTSQLPAPPTAEFSPRAVAHIQSHGQERGYALTIKRSIPSLQQVYYRCDRGSEGRSR